MYFAWGVPRVQKPAPDLFGQLLRGGGNRTKRARFIRATASQGRGGNRKLFGGGSRINLQKRAELILAIASQFKGAPNANSRGIDPGHCFAGGDTIKQNARNLSGPLHRRNCEHNGENRIQNITQNRMGGIEQNAGRIPSQNRQTLRPHNGQPHKHKQTTVSQTHEAKHVAEACDILRAALLKRRCV